MGDVERGAVKRSAAIKFQVYSWYVQRVVREDVLVVMSKIVPVGWDPEG